MNLVLGDVVETIYVVDEEDDDKDDIRVRFLGLLCCLWGMCVC